MPIIVLRDSYNNWRGYWLIQPTTDDQTFLLLDPLTLQGAGGKGQKVLRELRALSLCQELRASSLASLSCYVQKPCFEHFFWSLFVWRSCPTLPLPASPRSMSRASCFQWVSYTLHDLIKNAIAKTIRSHSWWGRGMVCIYSCVTRPFE